MKSFAKKFLSIALAAVLLLGVLPFGASAAGCKVQFIKDEAKGTFYDALTATTDTITNGMLKKATAAANADLKPQGLEVDYWIEHCSNPVNVIEPGETVERNMNIIAVTKVHEHIMITDVDTQATCTKDGLYKAHCDTCSYVEEKVRPATGHDWTDWKVVVAAKPGVEGKEERVCLTCNKHETRTTDALPTEPATEPTTKPTVAPTDPTTKPTVAPTDATEPATDATEPATKPAKPGLHLVTLVDKNGKEVTHIGVKHNEKITGAQMDKLNAAGKEMMPVGYKLDSIRIEDNNELISAGYKVTKDLTVVAVPVKDPDYNSRPDGPTYLFNITFDENWLYGAKTTYEIKAGQRLGTLFYKGIVPVPERNLHLFRGWYLCDENGDMTNIKWDEETIFNLGRHCTLKARWEREAEVYLRIYRNGNTTTPYIIHPLYGYAEGETIYTKDLKIGDYYKNGGKPFDFDGWYDRGGWTLYKAKDNPHPISSIKASKVGGQTIIYGMITDANAPSNKTPDHTNPKTGDESMIIATTAVMLVSAGALAVFFMDRKRRNG